ncbi:cupin [Spirulina sp. CCNP1310]|uniref:cysteine dioxygenase family protein n=1 Tax=Spirulina sp. CCNP1310 TaxID=3110249 RepID=UPI002B1F200E|nr:cupin [Spirulina sp. CCNP1310]MEA5417932.1 cupin [Spirulina sp. CCNP1310]
MAGQDWLIDERGTCTAQTHLHPEPPPQPYRLYRFLTDVEDILVRVESDRQRLKLICPLVRTLIENSPWLAWSVSLPDPETGWSVSMLYDEPDFPLTVQMVAWAGGTVSPIHNHGTWGIVALLAGQEKNRFWRRSLTNPNHIEAAGDLTFFPGDLITFLPDAIHQVEALGDEPTISFNLYGETNYQQRFRFDPQQGTANLF